MKQKNKSRKKNIKIALFNILGIAAVAFLVPYFTLLWIDGYTNHGEEIEVPDICRMHLEDAQAELHSKGLMLEIQRYEYSENKIQDEVLEQSPKAGDMVKEGRKIMVVLNTEQKPKVSVPGVIDNCSMREARARIIAAGFNISRVDTIKGEKDWVYKLRYDGRDLRNGEPIPMGADVVIVIGNGNSGADRQPTVATEYFD